MATPQVAHQFLSKAKLAGLLRQLLSYGVRLPDLSPLASLSNSTAAVILDVRRKGSAVGGQTQFSTELYRVRTVDRTDVMVNHEISFHEEFLFHCYCKPNPTGREANYQFWLSALGPNVSVNGKTIEMTGALLNIMASSVSFIQTSFRNTEFHLFVQLHELYWPAVDRNIKWEQHFYPMRREKIPTGSPVYVPDKFKHIEKIVEWMNDIENHPGDLNEQFYCHDSNEQKEEGFEGRPAPADLLEERYFAIAPAVKVDVPNFGKSSGHPTALEKSIFSHPTGISGGLNKLDGSNPLLGHRRSSRLKESTLFNRMG